MSRPRFSIFVLGAALGAGLTALLVSPHSPLRHLHLPASGLRLRMHARPASAKPSRKSARQKPKP